MTRNAKTSTIDVAAMPVIAPLCAGFALVILLIITRIVGRLHR